MNITFKFRNTVKPAHIGRATEIYHRIVGSHYQREVDSQAGISMMLNDRYCIGTSWTIPATPAMLADIINNPTIHDMLYIMVDKS